MYSGKATPVNESNFDEVPPGVKKVFEMVNSYFPGQGLVFKVRPKKIIFIDYSKGFGHTDVLEF